MKRNILQGAISGLLVWLVYGVVEFVLAYLAPRIWRPESQIAPWQWPLLGMVIAVYALAGIVFGAAAGAFLRNRDSHRIVAALGFSAAFAENLILAPALANSEQIALVATIALAAFFTLALVSETWRRRTQLLVNPWTVTLLLLIGPWLCREALRDRSAVVKTGASLAAMAMVLILAAAWNRIQLSKRVFLARGAATAAGIVWLAAQIHGSVPAPAASSKPNILLITMDTVRADHMSLYGYQRDTTPYLQEFARGATVYTRAIAAADMTLSSHASIFTGVYPSWHGAYPSLPDFAYGRSLAPNSTTLAGVLGAHGYWTGGLAANHSFLQASMGLAQGFTSWNHFMPVHLSVSDRPFYLRESVRSLLSLVMSTADFEAFFLRASDINQRAFALLEEARRQQGPFFLFVNYMDAHIPYVPPPPYRDRFPGRDPHFRPAIEHEALTQAVNSHKAHVNDTEKRHLISQYDGGIAYIDRAIADLLGYLRERGLYNNTLIVITSDHGEAFGERDLMQHAIGSVYEDQVHVPLIVKYPGQRESQRSDALASHVDLMPTLLDAAQCPLPAILQGRDLRSPRGETDPVFTEARALGQEEYARLRGVRRAIFSGSWKLIIRSGVPVELYDLAKDPGETENRYRADDQVARDLAARMLAWIATIPTRLSPTGKPDKTTLDRIKSLGYVQK